MQPLASLVGAASFDPATPIAVARSDGSGAIDDFAAGTWPNGQHVAVGDRFYVASLAKQVTGAAVALLVRDGELDADAQLTDYLDEMPSWTAGITARHLLHHTAGLPAAGELEAFAPGDWTEAFALAALRDLLRPAVAPGTAHVYSNLGYVLLARIVERVSGMPFALFVQTRLLTPLNVVGMGFETDIQPFPQAVLLGPRLPLTHGDGGLWSSTPAFARWLVQQNRDALGIRSIVEAPGRLTNGEAVAYGWGLGIRTHKGKRLLIHGGSWTGAAAKAVRSPELNIAIVAVTAGAPLEALNQLVETILNDS